MSEGKKNELAVITMAKELAKYVMTVTQKSPKHFRFSLVAKLDITRLFISWAETPTE